jgi:hypothetical protein
MLLGDDGSLIAAAVRKKPVGRNRSRMSRYED